MVCSATGRCVYMTPGRSGLTSGFVGCRSVGRRRSLPPPARKRVSFVSTTKCLHRPFWQLRGPIECHNSRNFGLVIPRPPTQRGADSAAEGGPWIAHTPNQKHPHAATTSTSSNWTTPWDTVATPGIPTSTSARVPSRQRNASASTRRATGLPGTSESTGNISAPGCIAASIRWPRARRPSPWSANWPGASAISATPCTEATELGPPVQAARERSSKAARGPTAGGRPPSSDGRASSAPAQHRGQELSARLLAAPAGLGAHPAVFVPLGMVLALVAAALAGGRAGLQQRPGDACVVLGLAAGDPDGGGADVGAVQAQPDALDQLGDVLLAQVGVGVGGAGLGALDERVHGGGQHAGFDIEVAWVGVQHMPCVAHGVLLARRRRDSTRVSVWPCGNHPRWMDDTGSHQHPIDPCGVFHVSPAALLHGLGPTRPCLR